MLHDYFIRKLDPPGELPDYPELEYQPPWENVEQKAELMKRYYTALVELARLEQEIAGLGI